MSGALEDWREVAYWCPPCLRAGLQEGGWRRVTFRADETVGPVKCYACRKFMTIAPDCAQVALMLGGWSTMQVLLQELAFDLPDASR